MSAELKYFWNSVKNHLTQQGLEEVARLYPELRDEAKRLLSRDYQLKRWIASDQTGQP
ncbi:MAG: hypothetical protein WCT19_01140 [Candidatus Paceibacterota bacterium]